MSIHPTAIVAREAVVPESCSVGPYCTIGEDVVLGERCELVSHVVLDGHLTMGNDNRIFSFACLGAPQDLTVQGRDPHKLVMGNKNDIREYASPSHAAPPAEEESPHRLRTA